MKIFPDPKAVVCSPKLLVFKGERGGFVGLNIENIFAFCSNEETSVSKLFLLSLLCWILKPKCSVSNVSINI